MNVGGILKINYDDFYKFLVSGGALIFIVFSIIASYYLINIKQGVIYITGFIIYSLFAIGSCYGISFGVIKWYDNQKVLDENLRLEVKITENKSELLKLELIRVRNEFELSKDENRINENRVSKKELITEPEILKDDFI